MAEVPAVDRACEVSEDSIRIITASETSVTSAKDISQFLMANSP
jgi:hypothetical protein